MQTNTPSLSLYSILSILSLLSLLAEILFCKYTNGPINVTANIPATIRKWPPRLTCGSNSSSSSPNALFVLRARLCRRSSSLRCVLS